MAVEDHKEDREDRLEDGERLVASWLYDNKLISKPMDYDNFKNSNSNDDASGNEGRGRRRRRGTNLTGFRVHTQVVGT